MCVALRPADFSNTTLYVGDTQHPEHGLVHVLGYQNHADNISRKANCMVLHFPSAEPMTSDNALDCSDSPDILVDMRAAAEEASVRDEFGEEIPDDRSVQVFDVGSYTVVMSATPSLIPMALSQVPERKRPQLNSAIFDWYQENFPNYSIALCCFDSQTKEEQEPMLWWYKPSQPELFVAPAIDAHDGNAPDLGSEVNVDHFLMVGLQAWSIDEQRDERLGDNFVSHPGLAEVKYSNRISRKMADFLPTYVAWERCSGTMRNGDFIIRKLDLTPANLHKSVERGIT